MRRRRNGDRLAMVAVLEQEGRGPGVTLAALFGEFLRASLSGLGGGPVWVRHAVVERRHWISDAEFVDILSLCQFLPGPNIIGIAVCVGEKLRGGLGALAA